MGTGAYENHEIPSSRAISPNRRPTASSSICLRASPRPGGATGAVDKALDGAISRLIASGDFTGKAGTTALLYTGGKVAAPARAGRRAGRGREVRCQGRAQGGRGCLQGAGQGQGRQALRHHRAWRRDRRTRRGRRGAGAGRRHAAGRLSAAQLQARGAGKWPCNTLHRGRVRRRAAGRASRPACAAAKALRRASTWRATSPTSRPMCSTRSRWRAARRRWPPNTGLHLHRAGRGSEMAALNMNILLAVSRGSANEAQLIVLEHAPAGTPKGSRRWCWWARASPLTPAASASSPPSAWRR